MREYCIKKIRDIEGHLLEIRVRYQKAGRAEALYARPEATIALFRVKQNPLDLELIAETLLPVGVGHRELRESMQASNYEWETMSIDDIAQTMGNL